MAPDHAAFPILTVDDLPAARAFYERLGFELTYAFPAEGDPVYVSLRRGASQIGLGERSGDQDEAFSYWVYVDDVDAALEQLRAAGVTVVAEPEDREWGERVARVRDPAGNLLYLGSPPPAEP